MKYIGAFFEFSRRVLDAAKKGGLPPRDFKMLDNLLTRTGKRNTVMAKGILSSLSVGGASEQDIARFGELLKNAEDRINLGKEPFSPYERKELSAIFKRAYLSSKTSAFFAAQMDELVAEQINEFISGTKRVEIGVPAKKTVRFEKSETKEEKKPVKV